MEKKSFFKIAVGTFVSAVITGFGIRLGNHLADVVITRKKKNP